MVVLASRPRGRLPVKRTEKDRKRAEQRRQLGPLHGQLIKDQTRIRYEESFQELCNFTATPRHSAITDWEAFDYEVGAFLEHLWEVGRAKTQASYALASLQYFRPQAKGRIPYSWRLLKAWNAIDLPVRATPIPPEVVLGLAGIFFQWRQWRLGWLILLGYSLFLRTGELVQLRRVDVILPGARGAPVVFIPNSKGSQRQGRQADRLVVRESLAKQALLALCHQLSPNELLGQVSPIASATTSAYRAGASLDDLLVRGRWQSATTARIYLDDALMELGTLSLPQLAQRRLASGRRTAARLVSQEGKRGREASADSFWSS